jgi:hypothetical protein
MEQFIETAFLFGALLAVGFWMFRWQYRRAEAKLADWVRKSNYQLIQKEPGNPFGTGPKAARAHNKQIMYRVIVSDTNGVRRRALVKIGSEAAGVLADRLVVEWEND